MSTERNTENPTDPRSANTAATTALTTTTTAPTPWLTVKQAAARAQVGPKVIYREVRAGRLQAARVGGRREVRTLATFVDAWLIKSSTADKVK
jgi:excisionase family DNA binding protein